MRNIIAWFAVVILLGGAAALIYSLRPPTENAARAPETPSPPEQKAVHPPIRYPVANEQGRTKDAASQTAQSLPPLDKSDGPMGKALADLFGAEAVKTLFNMDNIIQRVVVTLDNVTGRQLPQRYLPVKPVGGRFRVTEKGGRIYLSPHNYQRYTPYVRLAEAVDSHAVISLYVRFYPLFQRVYESLGYKGYFNDRLVAVIKTLLDTPQVHGPVKLIQPSVYYRYADPHLESLTAGQKILVRMGSDNARRIKAKLRTLRRGLMSLGSRVSH